MRPLPKMAERALEGQEGLENLTGLHSSKMPGKVLVVPKRALRRSWRVSVERGKT